MLGGILDMCLQWYTTNSVTETVMGTAGPFFLAVTFNSFWDDFVGRKGKSVVYPQNEEHDQWSSTLEVVFSHQC